MHAEHILLLLVGAPTNDGTLALVASLADGGGARLSVVLGVVDSPLSGGCCGIQAQQWQRLLDDGSRAELHRVVVGLRSRGCEPVNADVQVGNALADIVERSLESWDCDLVVVARRHRPWSSAGLTERRLRRLRRSVRCDVVELRGDVILTTPRLVPSL